MAGPRRVRHLDSKHTHATQPVRLKPGARREKKQSQTKKQASEKPDNGNEHTAWAASGMRARLPSRRTTRDAITLFPFAFGCLRPKTCIVSIVFCTPCRICCVPSPIEPTSSRLSSVLISSGTHSAAGRRQLLLFLLSQKKKRNKRSSAGSGAWNVVCCSALRQQSHCDRPPVQTRRETWPPPSVV